MTYLIKRQPSTKDGTFGEFTRDGQHLCYTLEDPWNDNKHGESCIPAGKYLCVPHSGLKFKGVWEVTKVPGRSAILIHNGSTIDDTVGCILVGLSKGMILSRPALLKSRDALAKLRQILPETFVLEIIDDSQIGPKSDQGPKIGRFVENT